MSSAAREGEHTGEAEYRELSRTEEVASLGTWHVARGTSVLYTAPVNVGGPGGGVARHGEVPPAQVISQQQHHVGPRPLPRPLLRPAICGPVVSAPADIIILSSSLHQARLGWAAQE